MTTRGTTTAAALALATMLGALAAACGDDDGPMMTGCDAEAGDPCDRETHYCPPPSTCGTPFPQCDVDHILIVGTGPCVPDAGS